MAQSDNFYSRFVAWTKIILPLIALAILSSLFLFSKSFSPGGDIQISSEELHKIAEREGISQPRYAGTTDEGISVSISANDALPGEAQGRSLLAHNIRAHAEMPDGATIEIVAQTGKINADAGEGQLSGGILLDTSIGYTAVAEGMRFTFDNFYVESIGAIAATSPMGDISAGEMKIFFEPGETESAEGTYVLVFQKGVMLVYKPQPELQE